MCFPVENVVSALQTDHESATGTMEASSSMPLTDDEFEDRNSGHLAPLSEFAGWQCEQMHCVQAAWLFVQPPIHGCITLQPSTDAYAWQSQSFSGAGASKGQSRRHQRLQRRRCQPAVPELQVATIDAEACFALIEDLDQGWYQQREAMASLEGKVLALACDREGCRLVQRALEVADRSSRAALVQEMHGHVMHMTSSPHANYVVQKVVEVLPSNMTGFIVQELKGRAEQVSRHRYGCRVLCRLLEHSQGPAFTQLIDEVLVRAGANCRHPFAHHVVESILEHGRDEVQRHRVSAALLADLRRCAQDRHASFVLQKALSCCAPEDVGMLVDGLVAMMPDLATTRFGSYLYKALCDQPSTQYRCGVALLQCAPLLLQSKHGHRLFEQA